MIPNSRMGSVIGKQGSKIKEIQDASGARLNASEGMLPGSTEVSIMHSRILASEPYMRLNYVARPERGRCCGCDPYRDVLYRQHTHRGPRACAIVRSFKLSSLKLLSAPTVHWLFLCARLYVAPAICSVTEPNSTTVTDTANLHSK
jgi:hypothetical protein